MSCCGETSEFKEAIYHSVRDGKDEFIGRLELCFYIKGNKYVREIEVGIAGSLAELDRLVTERLDILESQRPGANTKETRERWASLLAEAPVSLGV